jgi:hypothetical protein
MPRMLVAHCDEVVMPHVKERRTWAAQMQGQSSEITLKETR